MSVFPGNSGFLNQGLELRLDANLTVLAMSEPPGHSSGPTLRPREVKALFVRWRSLLMSDARSFQRRKRRSDPLAVDGFRLRQIESQNEEEGPLWRRKPVCLFVLSR